ncbi:unnamed protein product [Fraxinus pennsylvanica]|uniref:Uncharacterized protein n=1 Tax=Fraxinus pennsylvanica TaxID=56036 RepID=A0AAD2E6P4_9LAMI|nr:unnamed protein product [Fraxinus pennsylvanica]
MDNELEEDTNPRANGGRREADEGDPLQLDNSIPDQTSPIPIPVFDHTTSENNTDDDSDLLVNPASLPAATDDLSNGSSPLLDTLTSVNPTHNQPCIRKSTRTNITPRHFHLLARFGVYFCLASIDDHQEEPMYSLWGCCRCLLWLLVSLWLHPDIENNPEECLKSSPSGKRC